MRHFLGILCCASLVGCSTAAHRTVVSSGLRGPFPKKLAVLTFETVAGPPELGGEVTAQFQRALEGTVTLTPTEEVAKLVAAQRRPIDRPTARKMGKTLGVDAVLYGTTFVLLGDDDHRYYPEREPEVGVIAKVIDVRSGGILWSMSATATKPATALALRTTVREAADRFIKDLVTEIATAFTAQKATAPAAQATAQ